MYNPERINILDRVSWTTKLTGRRVFGVVVGIAADGVAYRVRDPKTHMEFMIPRGEITKECR